VQGIEQRIYAIIHKKAINSGQETPSDTKKIVDKNQDEKLTTLVSHDGEFGVLRTYWIDEFENYEI
jgi:hypothetical protein